MARAGLSFDVASRLEAERLALEALSVVMLTITADGDALELVGATSYEAELADEWHHVGLQSRAPVIDVVRSGRPLTFSRWSELLAVYPHLATRTSREWSALAFVPMTVGERPVGTWVAEFAEPHAFSSAEMEIMSGYASRWASRFSSLARFAPFSVPAGAGPLAMDDVMRDGFDALATATLIVSNDGVIAAANRRFSGLVGRGRDELVTARVVDLIHPGDHATFAAAEHALASGEDEVSLRLRLVRFGGAGAVCDVVLVALRHRSTAWLGTLAQFSAVVVDDRHLAPVAEALMDALPVGVAVFDLRQRFVAVNPAMARMNGRPVQEHLGRSVSEVLPSPFAEELSETLRRVSGGTPVTGVLVSGAPSGTGELRHFESSWIPISDSDGSVVATAAVVIDCTDRVRAEHAEARRRHSLEAVVRAMPTALAVVGPDGRYRVVNEASASLSGVSADEHVGRTVAEVGGPLFAAAIDDVTDRATGAIRETTLALTRRDGVRHDVRITGFPLPDDEWGYAVVDDTSLHVARRHVEALARIGGQLASATTEEEIGEVIATAVARELGTLSANIVVVDGQSAAFLSMYGQDPSSITMWRRFQLDIDIPITHTLRTGQPIWIEEQADLVDRFPDCADFVLSAGVHAVGTVPISVGRTTVGTLALAWGRDRTISLEERQWCTALADVLGQAIVRARHADQDRYVAEVLQRSLLPDRLHAPAWLHAAHAYRAAGAGRVGGDTLDVVACPGGAVAVIIADVCGHGIEAAGSAAAIRHALRAQLVAGAEPSDALAVADRALRLLEPEEFDLASAAVVVIRPPDAGGRSACTLVSAGHPRPVLVRDGSARLVESTGALLGLDSPRLPVAFTVEAGDRLILYTDGLTDTPRPRLDDDGLLELIRSAAASVDTLPMELLRRTAHPDRAGSDDTAIIVIGLVSAPDR